MGKSVFRSAVEGSDGEVDAGYLALFWTMAATVSAIPWIAGVGGWVAMRDATQAGAILQNVGVAIGAICTGAGVVIGAVGAFRMGDKPRLHPSAAGNVTINTEVKP